MNWLFLKTECSIVAAILSESVESIIGHSDEM
jgi:hypothetical protein